MVREIKCPGGIALASMLKCYRDGGVNGFLRLLNKEPGTEDFDALKEIPLEKDKRQLFQGVLPDYYFSVNGVRDEIMNCHGSLTREAVESYFEDLKGHIEECDQCRGVYERWKQAGLLEKVD